MSSSDRRAFLALLAGVPLGACGFTPVHGPRGTGDALRGTIRPDDPENRLGYSFVGRFEDRLGRVSAPRWALGYSIQTAEIAVGISPDNVITRYNVTGKVIWSIRPAGSDDPVMTGQLSSFTSYSATGTTVATLSARRDAEDRLMTILADQLVTTLIARADELSA